MTLPKLVNLLPFVFVWLILIEIPTRSQSDSSAPHFGYPTKSRIQDGSVIVHKLSLQRKVAPLSFNWDNTKQGSFVTALCTAPDGDLWVGTEDFGVWRWMRDSGKWDHYDHTNGLVDDTCYALCADRLGRIWAGTLNHGLSVFNGKAWRNYDRLNGPLGSHITALCASPTQGDVWAATEQGLCRYSLSANKWFYYTRAEGLPSNEATCLAFLPSGAILVGTDCDGIAMSSPKSNFHSWKAVHGPATTPSAFTGSGLPSGQMNALLTTHDGVIYAATTEGLAWSQDNAETWRFARGQEWKAKQALRWMDATVADASQTFQPLAEDYVTSLTECTDGSVAIGYRTKGYQILRNGYLEDAIPSPDYTSALVGLQDGSLIIGGYGQGVSQISGDISVVVKSAKIFPSFPVPASSLSESSLARLTDQVTRSKTRLPDAYYLGADWETQGDSVGHYGRKYARLFAAQSPWGDHMPAFNDHYAAMPEIGPHHSDNDTLRFWLHWLDTDNIRCQYDPQIGHRRQSEADDHGEGYDMNYDGPGIWLKVSVPDGLTRIALYDMNKDGHNDANRFRDYSINVFPFKENEAEAATLPRLAHARLHQFWGGVYKSFLLRGPAMYWVVLDRNYSFNTILPAVFMDKVQGDAEKMETVWLGNHDYSLPKPQIQETDLTVKAALKLERELDASAFPLAEPYRLLAYRSELSRGADLLQLARTRWKLHLWNPNDRASFDINMHAGKEAFMTRNPHIDMSKM